jgi:hypothetical protein
MGDLDSTQNEIAALDQPVEIEADTRSEIRAHPLPPMSIQSICLSKYPFQKK